MSEYRRKIEETVLYDTLACHQNGRTYLLEELLSTCSRDMFTTPHAAELYHVLNTLVERKGPIDPVAVGLEIRANNFSELTPMVFGQRLANTLSYESNVVRGMDRLKNEHAKHIAIGEVQGKLNELRSTVSSAEDIAEGLDKISQSIRSVVGEKEEENNSWDGYINILGQEKNIVPTPWYNLNTLLGGGIEDFELVVIAARPSVGKTAMALNFGMDVIGKGGTVLFYSLEMAHEQLRNRMLSSEFAIPYHEFKGNVSEETRDRVIELLPKLRGLKLHIRDGARYTVEKIRSGAKKLKAEEGLDMLFIDYLQLMQPSDKKASREQQVAHISRELKLLAKELRIPVVLLAQLNRNSERENRKPKMSDLRESGAIEQDADVVILLHAKKDADQNNKPVQAILDKGRSSGQGVASLKFNGMYQRFEDDFDNMFAQADVDEQEKKKPRNF